MHSFRIPTKSSSTITTTSVTSSGASQSELVTGQPPQGSFLGLPTTFHAPESRHIPSDYQQYAGLRLLSEISTSQINPFEALATHQIVTFDDDDHEQSDNSVSQSQKSSQPVEDIHPAVSLTVLPNNTNGETRMRTTIGIPKNLIIPSINNHFRQALSGVVSKAALIGIAGELKLPSSQDPAEQSPDPTDKRSVDKSQERPFKCRYPGCAKSYNFKQHLVRHVKVHTGKSKYKCNFPGCESKIYFSDSSVLERHIRTTHSTEKPFQCDSCEKRFGRKDNLMRHRRNVHFKENEQKSPK